MANKLDTITEKAKENTLKEHESDIEPQLVPKKSRIKKITNFIKDKILVRNRIATTEQENIVKEEEFLAEEIKILKEKLQSEEKEERKQILLKEEKKHSRYESPR